MRRVSPGTVGWFVSLCLVLFVLFGATTGGQQPAGRSNADPRTLKNPVRVNAESIAAGQQAYQKYCGFCHGKDARGNGPLAPKDTHPPDLTDATWDHGSTDGEIFVNTRDGVGPKFDMKGLNGKLTDQDIWSVVNYLRSLAPQGRRTR
jgi:mono/diheme cytochrome c family protein